MLLRYFYDQKLAQASYMIGCVATGEALIVDPGRNVDVYLRAAEAEGMRIIGVTETHIHADFVSGSRELAHQADATLYLSDEGDSDWKYRFVETYRHRLLKDGDTWLVGNIKIEAKHTPGHTPEHLSFIVTDTEGADKAMGVFTGDFVFVGDVGRPDLLETAAGVARAKEPAARALFNSIQRFRQLPDYLQLWPGHGAGSACGKTLGAVPSTTLGYERMFNWAFQIKTEDEFVKAVLEDQPEPPRYFAVMKQVNKLGPVVLGSLPRPPRLPASKLVDLSTGGALIIDTRHQAAFAGGFVPGTINIPLGRSFNTYAGWLLGYDTPYYLLIDEDNLDEAITDLTRIGLDNIAGYFDLATISLWSHQTGKALATIPQYSAQEASQKLADSSELGVLDVRWRNEFVESHLANAQHIPLGYIPDRLHEIPADRPLLVYCQTGLRSTIATSLLAAQGRTNVIGLRGGYEAWVAAGQPVVSDNH